MCITIRWSNGVFLSNIKGKETHRVGAELLFVFGMSCTPLPSRSLVPRFLVARKLSARRLIFERSTVVLVADNNSLFNCIGWITRGGLFMCA